MGKRKKSQKKNNKIKKFKNDHFDDLSSLVITQKEQWIEIQTEAYYRALKRIENEEKTVPKEVKTLEDEKWYEKLLFILVVLFSPLSAEKKYKINNKLHDGILVIAISGTFRFVGRMIWMLGIIMIISFGYQLVIGDEFFEHLITLLYGVLVMFLGSIFLLASNAFSRETDSNKIYAYSSSVFALISCIISLIAMFNK